METCKAQESVNQPLTALQTGEQRNMKSQCNVKNKDKTITIPYYTKIHYKSLTKALVKRWVFNAVLKVDKVLQYSLLFMESLLLLLLLLFCIFTIV